jgi:catechol 2,3-dioxygenase-like lactoylglutathione lyase family enzyme
MLKITESYATLPAQDIERARKFYEQKLGLKPEMVMPDGGVVFKTGNTGFLVFPSSGKASGSHTQIALEVPDVEEAVKELKRNGVNPEEYDLPGFKTEGGILNMGDDKAAWFKDSEGNLLSLGRERTAVEKSAAGGRSTTTNGH